jgi:hypothetical protein
MFAPDVAVASVAAGIFLMKALPADGLKNV